MRAEDSVRLQHMVEAAQSAIDFVSNRVSDETRAAHGGIPWKAIIGMRNRLVHAYFDINADVVWQTVTVEIPQVLPGLLALAATGRSK